MSARATPFELVFGSGREERFEAIRDELASAHREPHDRDAFLLQRSVAELLRELRPDEGLGEAMEALAALVHHGYLFWSEGSRVRELDENQLKALVARPSATQPADGPAYRPAVYVRLPQLASWGRLEGGPPEPLDGWFGWGRGQDLQVLAILGLSPGRPGFTTVEAGGPRPERLVRVDGSPPFAPITTDTGARAGITSVRGQEELLELAWRAGETS